MKKLCILPLVLIATCGLLQAQQAGGPPKPPTSAERLKRVNEKLKESLKLTVKQQSVVNDAYKMFFTEVDKLRPQAPPPPPPPDKAKVEPLAQKRDAAIKAALTAEQYKKYLEIEQTLRPKGPPGAPKPPKE